MVGFDFLVALRYYTCLIRSDFVKSNGARAAKPEHEETDVQLVSFKTRRWGAAHIQSV